MSMSRVRLGRVNERRVVSLIFVTRTKKKQRLSLQRLHGTLRCVRCIKSEAFLSESTNAFCIQGCRLRAKGTEKTRSRIMNSRARCVLAPAPNAPNNCVSRRQNRGMVRYANTAAETRSRGKDVYLPQRNCAVRHTVLIVCQRCRMKCCSLNMTSPYQFHRSTSTIR